MRDAERRPERQSCEQVGAWRSLVAHLPGGQGVAGSNPVAPTIPRSSSAALTRCEKPKATAMVLEGGKMRHSSESASRSRFGIVRNRVATNRVRTLELLHGLRKHRSPRARAFRARNLTELRHQFGEDLIQCLVDIERRAWREQRRQVTAKQWMGSFGGEVRRHRSLRDRCAAFGHAVDADRDETTTTPLRACARATHRKLEARCRSRWLRAALAPDHDCAPFVRRLRVGPDVEMQAVRASESQIQRLPRDRCR